MLFGSVFLGPSVYAASSIEFKGYQFSSSEVYQGHSNVYVDLKIANDGNSSIIVHGAFVHFDWQASNESFMVGSEASGEPYDLGKELDPAEDYTFRIAFSVPSSVSEGEHVFYFKVFHSNNLEEPWNPRERDPYAALMIHSLYEGTYKAFVASVEARVAQAEGAGFISPEAQSLVREAKEYLSDAHSYADQRMWQSASTRLSSCSARIDRAYEAEQRFIMFLIIAGVAGGGAAIGAGFFIRRRKKRSSESSSEKAE